MSESTLSRNGQSSLAPDDEGADVPVLALTAGGLFRQIARRCLSDIEAEAGRIGRFGDPEALHQTRVGLRRLRAAASAFKAMLADAESEAVRVELKWLAGELDEARDLDVFIAKAFPPSDDPAPMEGDLAAARTSFHRMLLKARIKAYGRVSAALESPRFAKLLTDVEAWLSAGAWTAATAPEAVAVRDADAAEFGVRALDRLYKKAVKAGRGLAHLDPDARHDFRIRIKKLRYGSEFFLQAAGGSGRRRFVKLLKALQEDLGALNDIVVSRDLALHVVGGRSGEAAFVAGRMSAEREADQPALLEESVRAFKRLKAGPKPWRG